MVQIVITHGRGQEYEVPAELQEDFERDLRYGLERIDAPYFDDVPVRFAFYGEAWRPDSVRAIAAAETAPSELQLGLTKDLLDAAGLDPRTILAAAGVDEQGMPATRTMRLGWDTVAGVAAFLDEHLRVGAPFIRVFLQDVDDYLRLEDLREKVIGFVADEIQEHADPNDDIVLLGHSLGSVVAYDLARRRPAPRVRGLLTFGSPLGLKTVRERLKQRGAPRRFPEVVRHWANVIEPRDLVTGGKSIKPYYPSGDNRAVEDVRSQARPALLPGAAHNSQDYLTSTALASALRGIIESLDPSLTGASRANGGGRGRGRGRAGARRPRTGMGSGTPAGLSPVQEERPTEVVWTSYDPSDSSATSSGARSPGGELRGGMRGAGERFRGKFGEGEIIGGGLGRFLAEDAERDGPTVRRAARGRISDPDFVGLDLPDDIVAALADGESEAVTNVVRRSASADFPPWVAPGSETRLKFQIGKRAKFDQTSELSAVVEAGADRLDLVVVVHAVDFEVVDENGQPSSNQALVSLDLLDPKASVEGSFMLRAPRIRKPRQTAIYVRFFHGNESAGQIVLPTEIGGSRRSPSPRAEEPVEHQGQFSLVPLGAPAPEISLHVDRLPDGRFAISGSRHGSDADFDSRALGTFPKDKVEAWEFAHSLLDRYREVATYPRDQREDRVNALGAEFWARLPPEFHAFYWKEMHNKQLSLVIQSDEPYIPWELLVPRRSTRSKPTPMFGRAFPMARWTAGEDHIRPLPISDFAVVAPAYALDPLDSAALEAEELKERFQARRIAPGRREQMLKLLRSRKLSALHFSGHGRFDPADPANSEIRLVDEPIDTIDMNNAKLGKAKEYIGPLIFLNACEVGQQGFALTQIGGWAEAFRTAGSAVFVGPYWMVDDDVARKVSMRFYGALRYGLTIGQAMQEVRRGFTEDTEFPFHPTWLAYSVHCQPNLKVSFAT